MGCWRFAENSFWKHSYSRKVAFILLTLRCPVNQILAVKTILINFCILIVCYCFGGTLFLHLLEFVVVWTVVHVLHMAGIEPGESQDTPLVAIWLQCCYW